MSSCSINDFYKNRSILVTGFTGFLGKVLVEKLIRSCPDVETVYVLVRSLKGKTAQERVTKILDSTLFEIIRKECPEKLKKIVPMNGDIMEENLALSPEDTQTLINNVTVVFHSAATVKFDEDLRFALQLNVFGTKRLLHLCRKMKNFAAFIHASTAYANLDHKKVFEKIYPAPVKLDKLANTLEWMDDETSQCLSRQLLATHNRPNTYTFTKSLGEQLMVDESSHLPIVIVRPSIIACALHEPSPGWIDNLNGATGILAAHYKGILRSIGFHEDLVIDAVPVDTVSNTMIAAGWQRANINDNSVPVIHVTSGQMNPLLLGRYRKCVNESCKKFPLMKQFRSPQITSTKNPMVFEINHFLLHLIPAHFADFVTKLFGGKPILVRVVKRLKYAIQVMQFAIENQWYFASKNIVELRQQMSEEDRKTFNIDIADFTWESYLENYVLGVRQHILQEDPSTIEMARKKAMRYKVFMNLLKTALFVLSLRMLNKKTQIIKRLWHFLLNNALPMLRFVPVVNRAILT